MSNQAILNEFLALPLPDDVMQVEYVWIAGDGSLRSKGRTFIGKEINGPQDLPLWNFDGSSTGQATGDDSEVLLKAGALFDDPFRGAPHKIAVCECLHPRTQEPIPGDYRSWAVAQFEQGLDEEPWFGLEQEYFLMDIETGRPLGWPATGFPEPQGPYYCGVGGGACIGRDVVEAHYRACLSIGIKISGVNGEVAPAQHEFQIGPCVGIEEGDHMIMARYLLLRIAEKFGVGVNFDPKPIKGDWNGSGCHHNYSTKAMREDGGLAVIHAAIEKLSKKHKEHIDAYGEGNEERLTGAHETASIHEFSSGTANRGASIRIGNDTNDAGKGYFEDRRPSSNCNPYLSTGIIFKTTVVDQ